MDQKEIDYRKLNERIVEQAYHSAGFTMTKDQLNQLVKGKFDRAEHYHKSLQTQQGSVYIQIED